MGGDWEEVLVGEAFAVNPNRPLRRGAVTPYVPMDALPTGARTPERIDERVYTGSGVRFTNGDTLIARITPCLENGKTAHVRGLPDGSVAHGSTEYIVLSGRDGCTDSLFAYYLARSPDFRQHAIGHMEGTTGRQRVPAGAIEAYTFALPPLSEQRAIALILGTLDDKIELNRRMSETLEAMARALFKSWFVDFDPVRAKQEGRDPGLPAELAALFPDRLVESELGEIPEGWGVGVIGDLTEVFGGTTPSTKSSAFWEGGIHAWATPKDLSQLAVPVLLSTERHLTDAGLAQIGSGLLPVGTVLLSSRAPIGYLAVAEVPVAINQGFVAMSPKSGVSSLYLLLWAWAAHEDILSRANGSTFQEISKSNFRQIPVVIPPRSVIEEFERRARPLYERIVGNTREANSLVDTRDALLPGLLSGALLVVNQAYRRTK